MFPDQKFGFNAKADKFVTTEARIRDVCETCNNGPLSKWDAYAKRLLTSLHCERTYPQDAQLTIAYEYDPLLRWLLKVSYNASRAVGEVRGLLLDTAPYLIGRGVAPAVAFLSVEVVRDTPVTEEIRVDLPEGAAAWDHIPTRMFRVGPGIMSGGTRPVPDHCLRFVAVNSWYFTFCLVPASTKRATRRQLARLYATHVADAAQLRPDQESVTIPVSRRTGMDLYAYQGQRVARQWMEYVAKSGRLS